MPTPSESRSIWLGDSVPAGFACCWGVLLASVLVAFMLSAAFDLLLRGTHLNRELGLLSGVLPALSLGGLLFRAWRSRRRQFTWGVIAGFASMFALTLLLVAACFGMFALG